MPTKMSDTIFRPGQQGLHSSSPRSAHLHEGRVYAGPRVQAHPEPMASLPQSRMHVTVWVPRALTTSASVACVGLIPSSPERTMTPVCALVGPHGDKGDGWKWVR